MVQNKTKCGCEADYRCENAFKDGKTQVELKKEQIFLAIQLRFFTASTKPNKKTTTTTHTKLEKLPHLAPQMCSSYLHAHTQSNHQLLSHCDI